MRYIIGLISILIIGIIGYFVLDYKEKNDSIVLDYKETIEIKEKMITRLDGKVKELKGINFELRKENKTLLIKIKDLKEEIVNINNNNILNEKIVSLKTEEIVKYTKMNVGEWVLTAEDKKNILSIFKEEGIYEIIPIVDENKYKNDKDGLKQIGLSRKRAAIAAGLIKSSNIKNRVYISTEIITSKNERGFIIKRVNFN